MQPSVCSVISSDCIFVISLSVVRVMCEVVHSLGMRWHLGICLRCVLVR